MEIMITDVKSIAKDVHNQIVDTAWQLSGVKKRDKDVPSLVSRLNNLVERYVQVRINMALTYGDVELTSS